MECDKLYNIFKKNGLVFFTGVPDSLLKNFCAYITDKMHKKDNIIAANEGNAIAIAAGYHLATGKIGAVYMQNSGLGNAINPLLSLADQKVYSLPMLLIIGWRGEPGIKDEPQHSRQGEVTLKILEDINIPYKILPDDIKKCEGVIQEAKNYMKRKNSPFAIIVKKNLFEGYALKNKDQNKYELDRERAIKILLPLLDEKDIIISTTGKTSRELFELRELNNQGHNKDFLTVGSMGHSSSIALGIALQKPNIEVYCFDGDGAMIMHMGSLSTTGLLKPKNFKHIIFNNFSHESVGGQPTAALNMDIPLLAKANGYKEVFVADTAEQVKEKFKMLKQSIGPSLLEIHIKKGSRKDLGRPTITPIENKQLFMNFLINQ